MTSAKNDRSRQIAGDGSRRSDEVEMVRSEERLLAGVEWARSERVKISKQIVTETRQVTVQVRREELVVERFPAADAGAETPTADAGGSRPVVELVLHEEVPEVTLRTRPAERVRVFVERQAGMMTVDAALRREQVELVDLPAAPGVTQQ